MKPVWTLCTNWGEFQIPKGSVLGRALDGAPLTKAGQPDQRTRLGSFAHRYMRVALKRANAVRGNPFV